jgi:hypothetical protein
MLDVDHVYITAVLYDLVLSAWVVHSVIVYVDECPFNLLETFNLGLESLADVMGDTQVHIFW